MKKTMKVGIAFAAIVFGLIASPAVAVSETEDMKESVTLVDTVSISSMVKTVMIVGHEDPQFVPQTIHLKIGDSIRFINQDGQDGGLAHDVVSVDQNGVPNGNFKGYLQNVGDTFTIKFSKVDSVTSAITDAASTGTKGDGKIFVSSIEESVDIATKEKGST